MMNTGRGLRDRMAIDRDMLALILAGVALLAAIFLPRALPAARRGTQCTSLASPLGGNNRSVLAYRSDQRNSLDLSLSLNKETFVVGEAVHATLTFANGDPGPVILYFSREAPILTANTSVQGVTFEITRVAGGTVADQGRTFQSPSTYTDSATLHLMGSRSRCNEEYVISGSDLSALGVLDGEYRIRAYYRSSSAGNAAAVQPLNPTATPFPEYTTQGVWVGEAGSNEVRFTITTG